MPFTIVRQDITKLKVDAIVNAANTELQMGGGVCGAIFKAAGAEQLQAACHKLAPIKTGEAVITPGFGLPAKYVIHAAGPVYRPGAGERNEQYLRAAYLNSLKRAVENECGSIAFPLISSGIYGYPKEEALQVATAAIQDFLHDHDLDITLAVFDKSAFTVSRELLGRVESYIDEHYVDAHRSRRGQLLDVELQAICEAEDSYVEGERPLYKNFEKMEAPRAIRRQRSTLRSGMLPLSGDDREVDGQETEEQEVAGHQVNSRQIDSRQASHLKAAPLADLVGKLDESFSQTLLRLIDARGKKDVEVYKRANLDRKLFSKIRSGKGYMPSKRTAIALAVALELPLDEAGDLLARAGYALSHAVKFDVIVEYFIISGRYDVFAINEVLFEYDQPLLGGG